MQRLELVRAHARINVLEREEKLDAGRRRIIARALRKEGFTGLEIANLLGVSASQARKDFAA